MSWASEEDVRRDMYELSDICKFPQPAPEPSEFMKKLRGKPSLFDDDIEDDEHIKEIPYSLGRGHSLLQQLRRPAGKPTFMQQQTSALIREVSGFGYGNDLIEHAFKPSNSEDEKDPEKMKNLAFDSLSHKRLQKTNGEESDSSTSTSEYNSYSSKSNSNGCINGPDIHSKKEFPDLK